MLIRHIFAAVVVAALWGASFVVVRVGLDHFPPLVMAALRFAVSALAAAFLPRPQVPWSLMIAIGLTLFVGEFGFLFSGMARGMPPGLASVAIQSQAFFTLIIIALTTRTMPTGRQQAGSLLGLAGLAVIASTVGGDVTTVGLALTIAAAVSWAFGNVLMKRAGQVNMLAMVAWLSLIPPVPLLMLSLLVEGPGAVAAAVSRFDAAATAAILYLAIPATLVAFAIWGKLLRTYPAQVVAQFSLLVPLFGILFAALAFGETPNGLRVAGMVLIVAGMMTIVLPLPWRRARQVL